MNLRAYAKINIGLRIVAKRSDGFHNIETVFHQIDLYDELAFEQAKDITLTTSSSHIPRDSRNLCVRAAETLREHIRCDTGVAINLAKQIPVGAGLGGGSSDAAAVLIALNRLWNAGLQQKELASLAAKLGSDIPFFIQGGTALGTSRGDVLEYFDLKLPYWILTVTPSIHVSTAWAYSNVRPHESKKIDNLRSAVEKGVTEPAKMSDTVTNDFEDSVFQSFPEIERIKDRLEASGALFAQMSGSGSSVFGFFSDEEAARKAMKGFGSPSTTSLTQPGFRPNRTE